MAQADAVHGEEGGRILERGRVEPVRQGVQPEQHDAAVGDGRLCTAQRPARILTADVAVT